MNNDILNHQQTFETILDTVIEAVITTDKRGTILFANKATTTLFGYAPKEIVGKDIKVLMPSYHQHRHDDYMNNYINTKQAKVIGIGRKVRAKKKNGNLFACWIGVSDFRINNELYFTGVLSDISKLEKAHIELEELNNSLEIKVKQRTKELKQALEKANELNVLKSKFLTLASHEFKTPLATILSSAILIEKHANIDSNLNEKQIKHIQRIKRSVNLLDGILLDFIDLERVQKNKIDVYNSTFFANDLIKEAIEITETQFGISHQIEVNNFNNEIIIYSDYRLCLYVLINLLNNACKFSGKNNTINVQITETGKQITISVIDKGIGISSENQKHIFDRFYRADNAKNLKGSGLGLSICNHYAELLKAKLTFESTIGKGSIFNFVLPRDVSNEPVKNCTS